MVSVTYSSGPPPHARPDSTASNGSRPSESPVRVVLPSRGPPRPQPPARSGPRAVTAALLFLIHRLGPNRRRLSRALSAFSFNARARFRCLPACSSALREGPGCSAGPIDSLREWPAQRVLSDSDHDSDCESDRVTTKACNAGPAARRPCGESSARVAQIPRHA